MAPIAEYNSRVCEASLFFQAPDTHLQMKRLSLLWVLAHVQRVKLYMGS